MADPIVPLGPLDTLRVRLLSACIAAANAKFTVAESDEGAVTASLDLDYPTALDGALAALFAHLEAALTGDALDQLAAVKAEMGLT
jgi:hypothetical protein